MRPNETKRLLDAGKPAAGIFVSSASPLAAEIVGGLGFDWVLVDLQHGENNLGNLSQMLQAVSITKATPFVRVPANDSMIIQRALDLGAYGIVVPMVSTVEQAERAVRAFRYAPKGERSWGPIRGSLYGGAGYFDGAEQELMLFAMIETAEAVENVKDILAVDGISGCYIGPNDLSISLGCGPEAPDPSALPGPVEEAIAKVVAAARETGKVPGIQMYDDASMNTRIRQGYRLVGAGTELRLMRGAAAAVLRNVERS
jgi:4-hydroxy-2-oxoheptanedioate aldolase